MQFTLQIQCDNEAFADNPLAEVRRILDVVSVRLDNEDLHETSGADTLRDINGNKVGKAQFIDD